MKKKRKVDRKAQPPSGPPGSRRTHQVDAFANPAAFLGESSPLISSGFFLRSGLSSDFDQLTAMYRGAWLPKRIIDMPSEDMTRAWYTFTAEFPPEDLDALRCLEARHAVYAAVRKNSVCSDISNIRYCDGKRKNA